MYEKLFRFDKIKHIFLHWYGLAYQNMKPDSPGSMPTRWMVDESTSGMFRQLFCRHYSSNYCCRPITLLRRKSNWFVRCRWNSLASSPLLKVASQEKCNLDQAKFSDLMFLELVPQLWKKIEIGSNLFNKYWKLKVDKMAWKYKTAIWASFYS